MSTRHTPGPWHYADGFVYAAPGAQLPDKCNAGAAIVLAKRCRMARDADARLIAAAPELLDALRMAAGFIESGESSGADFFTVRAAWRNAIAKATGETA